jgi:lysozyme
MAKTYTFSPKGIQFTERQEGVVLYVYDDAVAPTRMWKPGTPVHGHLTAGVGHLLNPAEIRQWAGKDIPKTQVDRWFDLDNNIAEQAVSRLVTVPLTPNQADVLLDFTFNNSPDALSKSTLLKRVNAGQFDKVPQELMKWDKTHINGKLVTSPGLQKRCADRAAYWNSAGMVPTPHDESKPSGTPIAERQIDKTSPLEWAGIGVSGISGLGSFASATGFLGIALGVVLVGAFVVGAAIIIKRQFFSK